MRRKVTAGGSADVSITLYNNTSYVHRKGGYMGGNNWDKYLTAVHKKSGSKFDENDFNFNYILHLKLIVGVF